MQHTDFVCVYQIYYANRKPGSDASPALQTKYYVKYLRSSPSIITGNIKNPRPIPAAAIIFGIFKTLCFVWSANRKKLTHEAV